jgi:PilZ domain-containing protein
MQDESHGPQTPSEDAGMSSKAVPNAAHRLSIAAPLVTASEIVKAHEGQIDAGRRALRPASRLAPPAIALPHASAQDTVVGDFLEAFRILLRSSRLYQRNHPRWVASLNTAEHRLRDALALTPSVQVRVEHEALTVSHGDPSTPHGLPVSDPHGELKGLAEEFARSGLTSLEFLPNVHLGELDLISQQIVWITRQRPVSASQAAANWQQWLRDAHITGIRLNVPAGRRDETVLATLIAALLGYAGETADASAREAQASAPASREQTVAALALVERLSALGTQRVASTEEAARRAHAVLAESERQVVALVAHAVSVAGPGATSKTSRVEPPRASSTARRAAQREADDSLPSFLNRAAQHLILDFARRSFSEGRLQPAEIAAQLADLSRVHTSHAGASAALGSDEARIAALVERFWDSLPARERQRVLRSSSAWCVPPAVLARHLEPLLNGADLGRSPAPAREAEALLLAYAACLESDDPLARRAVAAGLGELESQIARLALHAAAEDLASHVVKALAREEAPGISGLLAALTERLAKRALAGRRYAEFDRILTALEAAPRDSEQSHFSALLRGINTDDAWFYLVEDALANRSLDVVLPRLLRREPARLIDRLALLLTAAEGAGLFPAMVRLVRATGEPVVASLAARLHEPHRQPAIAAIKLLSAADPLRLIAELPRALPGWDWNLQDLAVSELSRHREPALALRISRAFYECMEEAHALVVPAMLDQIGLANDTTAIPLLLQIAAGTHSTLHDVFFRIKAVEALGRMRAAEAADLLRSIARGRSGLTHIEPAGLRSAAEEALAFLENHPAAARVRARAESIEKSTPAFSHPRRYLRIPLASSFSARLEGARSGAARIRTIGLGGAYVEASQRMSVGDSMRIEIRAGLRTIRSTAVVRNISADGGGVEFVHMNAEDRERLRRVIGRLLD